MYDDEAPDVRVLSSSTPVAHHGHACDGCPFGRHITPGTRYSKGVLLVDGKFHVQRHCVGGTCWAEHDVEVIHSSQHPLGPDELAF